MPAVKCIKPVHHCLKCGTQFFPKSSEIKRGYGAFCSAKCRYAYGVPFEQRFWKNIDKTDGCWLWRKPNKRHGYGTIKWSGIRMLAHRASWVLHFGEIPNGLFICHKCDVRNCVNPAHLFLGTATDNIIDMHVKGRNGQLRGECSGKSKLKNSQILEIRRLRSTTNITYKELSLQFGVGLTTIGGICLRKIWKHLE